MALFLMSAFMNAQTLAVALNQQSAESVEKTNSHKVGDSFYAKAHDNYPSENSISLSD